MTSEEKRIKRFKSKNINKIKKDRFVSLQDMPTDYRVQNFPRIGDKCDVSYPDGNYKGPKCVINTKDNQEEHLE